MSEGLVDARSRWSQLAGARPQWLAARRRSARVPRWAATTIEGRCRAEDWCPARLVGARRVVSGIAESSQSHDSRVVRDVYLRQVRRRCGPRDTRSKRRLAEAAVAAGALMPQLGHEAASGRGVSQPRRRLRVHRWTSRALLAKVASTIPRYQRPSGVRRQNVRGTIFSPATTVDRGERLRIRRGRAPASKQPPRQASASRSHRGRAAASSHSPSGLRRHVAQACERLRSVRAARGSSRMNSRISVRRAWASSYPRRMSSRV